MGIGGISIWQLLIILAIVLMLFGTKRLRNIGSDLGGALKGFRNAMKDDEGDGAEVNRMERVDGSDDTADATATKNARGEKSNGD